MTAHRKAEELIQCGRRISVEEIELIRERDSTDVSCFVP